MKLAIYKNTDAADLESHSVGLTIFHAAPTLETLELLRRQKAHENRGLHVQIRHNREALAYETACRAADLFSAAPEMLATLRDVLVLLLNEVEADPSKDTLERSQLFWRIRQLIAKASGE